MMTDRVKRKTRASEKAFFVDGEAAKKPTMKRSSLPQHHHLDHYSRYLVGIYE